MWSLNKVHQVGELVAAIAVVISLIFVGLEVRDNTVASEAATYQSLASDDVQLLLNVSSSPELSRIYEAYMFQESDGLTENEVLQAQWQLLAQLRFMENLYFQYELGMLPEDVWAAREGFLRSTVRGAGFEKLRSRGRDRNVGGAFRDYIEHVRARPNAE